MKLFAAALSLALLVSAPPFAMAAPAKKQTVNQEASRNTDSTVPADRPVKVKVLGTFNFSSVSIGVSGASADGIFKVGGGVLVSQNFNPFMLESGLLFTTIGLGSNGNSGWENYLQIPVLAAYKFGVFSAGLGPYIGFGLGSGSSLANQSVGYFKTDIGLMAKAGADIPVSSRVGIVGELAYEFGLADISTGLISVRSRNFMILVGASYGF